MMVLRWWRGDDDGSETSPKQNRSPTLISLKCISSPSPAPGNARTALSSMLLHHDSAVDGPQLVVSSHHQPDQHHHHELDTATPTSATNEPQLNASSAQPHRQSGKHHIRRFFCTNRGHH